MWWLHKPMSCTNAGRWIHCQASPQWLAYLKRTMWIEINGMARHYSTKLCRLEIYMGYIPHACMQLQECFQCNMEIAHLLYHIRQFPLVSKTIRICEKWNGNKALIVHFTSTYPLNVEITNETCMQHVPEFVLFFFVDHTWIKWWRIVSNNNTKGLPS